jgi:peptidyl-prolyl cis-trans isomerase C
MVSPYAFTQKGSQMKGQPRTTFIAFAAAYACAASLLVSSCSGREAKEETAPATGQEPAPEAQQVDLSQATQLFGQPPEESAPSLDPTTVVARVNGEAITQAELDKEIERAMIRMRDRVPPARMGQFKAYMSRQALENMVTQQILLKAVADEKIEVSDADFAAEIEKIKSRIPPNITMEKLYELNGMDEAEFNRNLRLSIQIDKLIEKHTADLPKPTDEVVKSFYEDNQEQFEQPETVRASHILVMVDENDSPEAKAEKKAKAEKIHKELVDGGDFAKLAEENSDDPGSKAEGGDLGPFRRGMMVPPFEEAAFTQKIGEIGPIVETQFGYHIIKVTEHDDAKMLPFDEVKEKLTEVMVQQDQRKAAEDYVETLKAAANIERHPAYEMPEMPMGMMGGMPPPGAQPTPPPAAEEAAPAETPVAPAE